MCESVREREIERKRERVRVRVCARKREYNLKKFSLRERVLTERIQCKKEFP